MKVFRVYNGQIGYGAVHRIVVAHNESDAISMVAWCGETWEDATSITAEEVVLSNGVEVEDCD
jgi:hypothetical protein